MIGQGEAANKAKRATRVKGLLQDAECSGLCPHPLELESYERCQTFRALMPAPIWLVAIRDPAHAYMLRSSGGRQARRAPLRRLRTAGTSLGYAPLGAPLNEPSPEDMQRLRAHAGETNRDFMARVRDVEDRHRDVLRSTAEALMRVGTATLRTSAGDIRARIIRFRRGAVVLEIHFPGGWSQGRSSLSTMGDIVVGALANALASTRPEAEPLP